MQAIHHDAQQNIADVFGIGRGITALVGGGGKTTLLYALADALSFRGRVIVTTSTHILPPNHLPIVSDPSEATLAAAFSRASVVCVGIADGRGKLIPSDIPMSALISFCDYLLVEADGAKRLPLKAPAAHEPVIPEGTDHVIAVAGLDGIGKPISQAAFRAERYAALVQKPLDAAIDPSDVATVLQHPNGQRKSVAESMRFSVLLNKADTPAMRALGEAVAEHFDLRLVSAAVIASLGVK